MSCTVTLHYKATGNTHQSILNACLSSHALAIVLHVTGSMLAMLKVCLSLVLSSVCMKFCAFEACLSISIQWSFSDVDVRLSREEQSGYHYPPRDDPEF